MKPLLTTLFLAFVAAGKAQVISVKEMMEKANCKDSSCFSSFILSKGFVTSKAMYTIYDTLPRYHYRSASTTCYGYRNENYNRVMVKIRSAGPSIALNTPCKKTYKAWLKEIRKEGFKRTRCRACHGKFEYINHGWTSAKYNDIILWVYGSNKMDAYSVTIETKE